MNYRNKALLTAIKDCPCQYCGSQDGTVVAAHSNQIKDGKGTGIKAHDYRIAALCSICHHQIDQGFMWDKEQKRDIWDEAHRRTMGWLFENGFIEVKK